MKSFSLSYKLMSPWGHQLLDGGNCTHASVYSTPMLWTSLPMQIVPAMKITLSTLIASVRRCCGMIPGLNYREGSSLKVSHKVSLGISCVICICSDVAPYAYTACELCFWWWIFLIPVCLGYEAVLCKSFVILSAKCVVLIHFLINSLCEFSKRN